MNLSYAFHYRNLRIPWPWPWSRSESKLRFSLLKLTDTVAVAVEDTVAVEYCAMNYEAQLATRRRI